MANMRMIGMGGVECEGGGGGGLTDLLTYNSGSCPIGLKKGFVHARLIFTCRRG